MYGMRGRGLYIIVRVLTDDKRLSIPLLYRFKQSEEEWQQDIGSPLQPHIE